MISDFKSRFTFNPEFALYVGCEREAFIVNKTGEIVPFAERALRKLNKEEFGFELSACQLESRIGPVKMNNLLDRLRIQERYISDQLKEIDLGVEYLPVAPDSMPLDVYPDPSGRYQRLVVDMPREILLSACRVTGTHCHVGMPNFETALLVYNFVIKHSEQLIELGNLSDGERLYIYKKMAPDCSPISYESIEQMYDYYLEHGFVDDPRKCWHFIRISVHGTIEFRMFDSTSSSERIVAWAQSCLDLCEQAIIGM